MTTISDVMEIFYTDHEVKPYISPERDLEAWLLDSKPVPQTKYGAPSRWLACRGYHSLVADPFWNLYDRDLVSWYFEYTYGIHASEHLKTLVEKGYVYIESAFDSLDHINATMKKPFSK